MVRPIDLSACFVAEDKMGRTFDTWKAGRM